MQFMLLLGISLDFIQFFPHILNEPFIWTFHFSSVIEYEVSIYTGGLLGSDTEAHVHLCIHGNKGDTGVRPLQKSVNNEVPFQESQVIHCGAL